MAKRNLSGIAKVVALHKVSDRVREPNIRDYLSNGKINLVINIPTNGGGAISDMILQDEYSMRRPAIENDVPVVTTLELASTIVEVIRYFQMEQPEILALDDYMRMRLPTTFP